MRYEDVETLSNMVNPESAGCLEKIGDRCRENGHGTDATILHVYSNQIGLFLLEMNNPGHVPEHSKAGLDAYVKDGIPPGGFLQAVLSNDLKDAFGRADIENRTHMVEIVNYLYNKMPVQCQGSRKIVEAWLKMHDERRAKEREEADGGAE